MRYLLSATAVAMLASLGSAAALAQTPSCTHTVGMVVSLTGAAGRYGQAASKSVELAFNDLNKAAGGAGIAGCKLAFDVRDAQSQGSVAVDQARQLVDLKKTPAIIGGGDKVMLSLQDIERLKTQKSNVPALPQPAAAKSPVRR